MALSKSKPCNLSVLIALSASAALSGCFGGDEPDGGKAARSVRGAAPPDGYNAPVRATAAYWAVDRIEYGASGGGVAVLEDVETLLTEERPVKDLPDGVEEGQLLAGGTVGGALWIDTEAAAIRAAGISERFERLK